MEFNKYLLKDIATIIMGQSPKSEYYSDFNGTAFLQGNRTFNNLYPTIDTYTTKITKTAKKNDILFSVRAPVGEINIAPFELCIGRGLSAIRSKNKDNKFLHYLLIYKLQDIHSKSTGTIFNSINKSTLENLEIKIPIEKFQKFIGTLLRNIDNKIELNNKIIANLEELSQTLFKRWFVDFEFPDENGNPYKSSGGEMVGSELGEIPKEWQVVKLEMLIDNVKDRINAKSVSSNFPYVPIDLIPKRKLTFYNYKDGKEAKSSLIKFKRNDILLGNMRVYFHRVCLAPFEGVTRNTVFTLRPKDERYTYYLINLINKDEFIEYASNNSKGSTMPYAVWEGVLDKIKVIKPPLNYLNQFNSKIKSNFELSISLLKQNRKLAILRDTLLPKLMSGEIEIPDDVEVNTDELSIY
ncbi:restriction endonuclease subunit S [Staphylococcus aureus]|uniref:restriction endonuclease subunit S n=1 Tax=Staphylococcus TaxID=1279 RepID=UPI000DB4EED7|nr:MULTISPECIES: restriction endonuclease subunit S [Staphylococcus]MBN4913802.1 restriction endonuclease subunit S [Staphylococcus sp. EG-SA-13]MBK3967837.1 restriction endonuclease subunit S [Staphylococcus aureus]MBK3989933.1 restriction endonuclease subunit S [Staphylococcus aureus]MBK4001200.1 restriction endonuclease subunit S [Staphylococcus aureus]MBK4011443.1 restriction endonuclease subunit S [Staphylococcus aureus]